MSANTLARSWYAPPLECANNWLQMPWGNSCTCTANCTCCKYTSLVCNEASECTWNHVPEADHFLLTALFVLDLQVKHISWLVQVLNVQTDKGMCPMSFTTDKDPEHSATAPFLASDSGTWSIHQSVMKLLGCNATPLGWSDSILLLFNEATLSESSLTKVDTVWALSLAVEGWQNPYQHLQWGQSMPGCNTVLLHVLFSFWDSKHSAYSDLLVSGEGADYSATSDWERHQSLQPTVVCLLPWAPYHITGRCPQTFGYR